jgi:hypothetical protein
LARTAKNKAIEPEAITTKVATPLSKSEERRIEAMRGGERAQTIEVRRAAADPGYEYVDPRTDAEVAADES